jgi:copper chaperone
MATYEIKGMTCNHCVMAVTKALKKVPGVSSVERVELQSGRAVVEGTADDAAVIKAITDEGYQAQRAD